MPNPQSLQKYASAKKHGLIPICTRVSEEEYDEVKAYARGKQISISEALRRFITWGLENA